MQFLHWIVVIALKCLFDEVIRFVWIICDIKGGLSLGEVGNSDDYGNERRRDRRRQV